MQKVLLYLGKFPGFGFDIDGGSILARQLIDTLKHNCELDVVFIRKNKETYEDNAVHSIRYVEYKDAFNNKFVRRLENLNTNREAVGDYKQYDKIISAHVSKFFGFKEDEKEFWNKAIIFPMFCTSSYRRAGEEVPVEYTEQEKIVLSNVNKIITPSEQEKTDLINDYNCNSDKIVVIYRGINPLFVPKSEISSATNLIKKIVYIASIKQQKNNIEALKLLRILLDNSDLKFELHLVCTNQDNLLYKNMLTYISEDNLTSLVNFHFSIIQEELANLLQNMDINISVSNWETFGRGIFEGLSCGLPTFVFTRLEVIRRICGDNSGVIFCENVDDMAKKIIQVCSDTTLQSKIKEELMETAKKVSYEKEQKRLLEEILIK